MLGSRFLYFAKNHIVFEERQLVKKALERVHKLIRRKHVLLLVFDKSLFSVVIIMRLITSLIINKLIKWRHLHFY